MPSKNDIYTGLGVPARDPNLQYSDILPIAFNKQGEHFFAYPNFVRDLIAGFEGPARAFHGQVDPETAARETAMAIAGTNMAGAGVAPEGSLGMIRGANWLFNRVRQNDPKAIDALKMITDPKYFEALRNPLTGVDTEVGKAYRPPELNQLRIHPTNAKLDMDFGALQNLEIGETVPFRKVLDANYLTPDEMDMLSVKKDIIPGNAGGYQFKKGTIRFAPTNNPARLANTLAHETQHAIQYGVGEHHKTFDKLPLGGSNDMEPFMYASREEFPFVKAYLENKGTLEARQLGKQIYEALSQDKFTHYLNLYGEAEARNAGMLAILKGLEGNAPKKIFVPELNQVVELPGSSSQFSTPQLNTAWEHLVQGDTSGALSGVSPADAAAVMKTATPHALFPTNVPIIRPFDIHPGVF